MLSTVIRINSRSILELLYTYIIYTSKKLSFFKSHIL
nr:MAG TPA: hypothetical protein [Caudoviricetes sp.]